MPFDISGQNAIITGASSGIGSASAKALAQAGVNVILIARREERLKELKQDIQSSCKVKVHCMPMDMMDYDAIAKVMDSLPEEFKPVHILLNNAGLASSMQPGHKLAMEDVHKMFDTNVKGVIAMCGAVVPHMEERNYGHVINISSVWAHEVAKNGGAYCASKHAVQAYTDCLRHDLVATQIRVTAILPGPVETEFNVVRQGGDKEAAKSMYEGYENLVAEDIAENVMHAATRPPHVQITEIATMPTNGASVTNISRS